MANIHLLSLSLDTSLFDPTSPVYLRQQEYASYFTHTTILVLNYGLNPQYSTLHTNNLTIIPVNAWNRLTLLTTAYLKAKQIYHRHPYQLITTQDPLATGLIGKWLKSKFHLPLNVQIHTDIFSPSWRKQTWLNRLMIHWAGPVLQSADSIRVVSASLKQSLLRHSTLYTLHSTLNVFIAPIRVDLDAFYKPAHFRTSCTRFISVGRLAPEKNYTLLIDSFAQITRDNPQAKLTIVGDGPEKDKLASQIVNYGLNDRIFLVGKKSTAEVAALLHQHDVFLLTSNYEGWGMVYVEAFAAGLPVITTPVSSVGELLQPDQNCLIASSTSHFTLHISHLINHPEEAYRLAKNGQMWVKQNLDSKILVKHWIDGLYRTIKS